MRKPGISVIVCCYNSATRIKATLSHLVKQRITESFEWEIIVIDNNSTDDTSLIANQFLNSSVTSMNWKIVFEPEPGLSNARNKGFDEAQFNIVLMVDDDNSLSGCYLQGIWDSFKGREKVGMVGGLGLAEMESTAPSWFIKYSSCYAIGPQSEPNKHIEHLYGAGLALRMDVLDDLKKAGFKSLLTDRVGTSLMSGGDTELCFAFRMAGFELVFEPELTFKHHLSIERIQWGYLRRLYSGFGHTKAYMDIYTSAVSGRALPTEGRLPFWLDRAIFLGKNLITDVPILILGQLFRLEENDKLLTATARLGQLRRIIHLRSDYLKMFQRVYALRNSLLS